MSAETTRKIGLVLGIFTLVAVVYLGGYVTSYKIYKNNLSGCERGKNDRKANIRGCEAAKAARLKASQLDEDPEAARNDWQAAHEYYEIIVDLKSRIRPCTVLIKSKPNLLPFS